MVVFHSSAVFLCVATVLLAWQVVQARTKTSFPAPAGRSSFFGAGGSVFCWEKATTEMQDMSVPADINTMAICFFRLIFFL
jgi:hypothetical protein